MEYIQVLDNLKKSINQKGQTELFKISLKNLKNSFGQNVSLKFLRNLSTLKDFRKKTKRISYLMRANGLKTKRNLRFFKEWALNKYNTDITEYGINKKGKVFIKNVRVQDVGREFIGNFREICFIVQI